MNQLERIFHIEKKRTMGAVGVAMAMRVTDEFPWELGVRPEDGQIDQNEDKSWAFTDENGVTQNVRPGEGFWVLSGYDLNLLPRIKYVKRGSEEYYSYNVVSEMGGVIIASLSMLDEN